MSKKILLIVNPISGTKSKAGLEDRVRERLEPAGFEVEVAQTQYAGHGAERARKAADEGYYAVLAAGGDGTVNEIASALRGSRTILGILPFGSGNGLARHIYGSVDIDHVLEVIARDEPQDCDYGTVNDQPFFCTFGLGFDAKVSKEFALMPTRGLTSYVKSAMHEWLKYSPSEYEITIGAKTIRLKAFLVAVCNASQYGNNAYIAPQASIRDGLLDLVIVHVGNPLTQALVGADLFTGNIDRNLKIQKFSVTDVTIRHTPAPGHIDGEPCTMPETMRIECHKGNLRIFTDPDKHRFKPFLTPLRGAHLDSNFRRRENSRLIIDALRQHINRLFNKK